MRCGPTAASVRPADPLGSAQFSAPRKRGADLPVFRCAGDSPGKPSKGPRSGGIMAGQNTPVGSPSAAPKVSFFNDPIVRGRLYQLLVAALVIAFAVWIGLNTAENLARQNKTTGFDFFTKTSGFDIFFTLIPYSRASYYWEAFLVGILNTALVSVIGIFFATIWDSPLVSRGCPITGSSRVWPRSISKSCATFRCCFSSFSGTSPFSRRCPTSRTASFFSAISSSTIAASTFPRRSMTTSSSGSWVRWSSR